MARLAGYETTVIDPRGMFAAAARFDQPVDENWPDEALDRWRPDGGSAVVSLTHDPKLDDPALAGALNSPAFYIGALGRSEERRVGNKCVRTRRLWRSPLH